MNYDNNGNEMANIDNKSTTLFLIKQYKRISIAIHRIQ